MGNLKTLTLVLFFLFVGPVLAKAKFFGIKVMGAFQSQRLYRGAVTWTKPSVMAGPAFIFFERLSLAGPSLQYSHFKKEDVWEFNLGVRYFDDNKPLLPLGDRDEDFRNQRKNSLEFKVGGKYKFGYRQKFFIGGQLGRELIEYQGLYGKISLGSPLLPFTSLAIDLGVLETSTSKYLYGPEARSGQGHADLNFKLVIPFVPWDGIAMFVLKQSWVLQKANQQADYIRVDDSNSVFIGRLFWNAL